MFTRNYELLTAITNVVIFVTSFICFWISKNKSFKKLFLLLFLDGVMGSVIHGIVMTSQVKNILWIILSFFFSITGNYIFILFFSKMFKFSYGVYKKVFIILSVILYVIFICEFLLKIDFLNTFIIYALIDLIFCFCVCLYNSFFKNIENDIWYLFGIGFQFIGGIFLYYSHFKIWYLDKNGLYHLCMVMTIIFFCIGNVFENKKNLR